ncbi:MAG: hypothetical protein ACR2LK_09030 [Solirubrobacteraceae bacterium]
MSSAARRLAVRFDEAVWNEAVRGFSGEPLQVATSARLAAARRGIALADVRPCEAGGPDGTEVAGCAKLYLPLLADAPPSERPFAFVLRLARGADGALFWIFVAFGHRHPRPGVRSVYERAHRQLHGRFPEPR